MSTKISDFLQSNILISDNLTFIRSGTNYKTPVSDLITLLGTTGSIESIGNGTPTLKQPVVGQNQFRAIEGGAGIVVATSPTDGIEVKWGLTQDNAGVELIDSVSSSTPVLSSLKAGDGISVTKDGDTITLATTGDPSSGLNNRIVVTQASDLSGVLDSTKEYFIDGIVDMGSQTITVPAGGLNLTGYNFDVSKLISSQASYTMFVSPGGGSGNLLGKDYGVEVTGAGSQVYNLTSATGLDAFEFARINYNNCTSLGEITNYRQGLEVGTGRFGGQPELTLSGTWLGGYFIDTSIVRSLTDGAYTLFKAGTAFVMNSRFRSNQNIDLPASASFFDFAPSNFVNPSTVQVQGVIITRNGTFDATDSNITPNIDETALVSAWTSNNGMPNTFEGGSIGVTTSAVTTINTIGVFETLNATTWTPLDLQHFDNPADGQLRHLGNTPREYKIVADFTIEGPANDVISLRVRKFDSSAASFSTVLTQTRQINALVGGRDVAFFAININTELDQNDYVFLEVANQTTTGNVEAEVDSYYIVEDR